MVLADMPSGYSVHDGCQGGGVSFTKRGNITGPQRTMMMLVAIPSRRKSVMNKKKNFVPAYGQSGKNCNGPEALPMLLQVFRFSGMNTSLRQVG